MGESKRVVRDELRDNQEIMLDLQIIERILAFTLR